ncbi:MAG: hypothetical protein P8R54_20610 [Myxococcota bacterium]|nr:hypothetical protein [Myxococcota bacterium]
MDDDEIQTPMLNSTLKFAVGLIAASLLVQITSQQSANGEVTFFRDWGATGFGSVAIAVALFALKDALSPYAPQHKAKRLGLIVILCAVGASRVLYGLGVFV